MMTVRAKSIRPRYVAYEIAAWVIELEDIFGFIDEREVYETWCQQNAVGTYVMPGQWGKCIVFANKEDAMMCFLTFR